jgi:hypothetical protein
LNERFGLEGKFIFLEQPEQLQQFQHYQVIMLYMRDVLKIDDSTWLVFGDADDKWQDVRVDFMKNTADARVPAKKIVVFNRYLVFDENERRRYVEDPEVLMSFEYWMALVKFDVFRSFFDVATEVHFQSPWCDLAYDRFLHRKDEEFEVLGKSCFIADDPTETRVWLYFKNGNGSRKAGEARYAQQGISKFLERYYLEHSFPSDLTEVTNWIGFDDQNGCIPRFRIRKPLNLPTIRSFDDCKSLGEWLSPACCNPNCPNPPDQTTFKCGACKRFSYCSVQCQKKHWKTHKPQCRQWSERESELNTYIFGK